ncbi:MAG: glycosyltransferase family 2 protein, partial [Desulfobacterota bacterium]|nr:glycosyltransferase family 2 protein [Thermodesulfobacteriota bacterium]
TVDIGIVTWNRKALTERCIESVLRTAGHPLRLFVADNGSTDGTREYLHGLYEQGEIHRLLLLDRNYGVAPASNSLWELSDAKFFLKLDNDVEALRHGWLAEMVRVCVRNPEVGLLAFSFQKQLYGKEYPRIRLSAGDVVQDPDETLNGACIMVPRATWHRLGFWCEDYAPYGEEDADYCQRAYLLGMKLYYLAETDWMAHRTHDFAAGKEEAHRYWQWKQQRRAKHTGRTGLATINVLMYNLSLRAVYMRRKFKTVILEDGITARLELCRNYVTQEGKTLSKMHRLIKHTGGQVP